MGDFNMVSLILGLASIAVGTLQPAVRYILISAGEKETNSTPPQQNNQQVSVSANVEPQIKYSSKPVQEKIKTTVSPISFVKETSALQE